MLDRIRASIPALPPAEQRVAKLVLSDPRSFASMPVGELAERSHVSKPTVVRFCRSVGYDGLADGCADIVVNFRPTPHSIFPGVNRPNQLVIKLQPDDGLELHLLAAKGTAQHEPLTPVFLDLDFGKAFPSERVGAYERLLLDAIAGRLNLFVRSDEQEQAWRWVEPILDAWDREDNGPRGYAAGSWGPPAASALVARDGFTWSEEE